MYYLYFKNGEFVPLSDRYLIDRLLIPSIQSHEAGAQLLCLGLSGKGVNATEFLVWGGSIESVIDAYNKNVYLVMNKSLEYLEDELYQGITQTINELEKINALQLREFICKFVLD